MLSRRKRHRIGDILLVPRLKFDAGVEDTSTWERLSLILAAPASGED